MTWRGDTAVAAAGVDEGVLRDLETPAAIDPSPIDLDDIRARVKSDGYAIVEGVIAPDAIAAIRRYWLERYSGPRPAERVNWSPYLGQSNMIGFTDDSFQCLYRSCDFLWNPPSEPLSHEVCLYLNRVRNLVLGQPLLAGEVYAENRYGVFITTSYYPAGNGWMKAHSDGVTPGLPLVHFVAPLTHRGIDYASGGMVVVDRRGNRVEVDARMKPGSVVYYDGSLEHGVDRIQPLAGSPVGRLQMFAIPTLFTNAETKQRILEKISYRALTRAKLSRLKSKVLTAFGREAMR